MRSRNIMRAKVSAKGWVVIPSSLRHRHRLAPGTHVEFREEGNRIVITPITSDPVENLFGKLAGRGPLAHALLKSRAKDREREETKLRTG